MLYYSILRHCNQYGYEDADAFVDRGTREGPYWPTAAAACRFQGTFTGTGHGGSNWKMPIHVMHVNSA